MKMIFLFSPFFTNDYFRVVTKRVTKRVTNILNRHFLFETPENKSKSCSPLENLDSQKSGRLSIRFDLSFGKIHFEGKNTSFLGDA